MDTKQIKDLMQEFDESSLSKLKLKKNDFTLELEKNTNSIAPVAPVAPVSQVIAPVTESTPVSTSTTSNTYADADKILSPMVGTFYTSPSPDSPPFVKAGDIVKKGQVLAILEAMKIMNELEADFDCKIIESLATNGQAVEYDMPLFIVEKI